jgi:hypothetical protein
LIEQSASLNHDLLKGRVAMVGCAAEETHYDDRFWADLGQSARGHHPAGGYGT